jgi:DNA polymerase
MWFQMYKAALEAVEFNETTKWGHIYFKVKNNRLAMRLRTGRCLYYNNPLVEMVKMPWGEKKKAITFMGINPYTRKWSRMQITPGRLSENLIQADSREIIVRGKLNVEQKGYRVLGSLHDEILSVREIGQGSTEEFSELMCNMGSWADGLPLAAGSWTGQRYRKE